MNEQTLELTVVADCNDGDYSTKVSPISQEQLDSFTVIFVALNKTRDSGSYFNSYKDAIKDILEVREALLEDFDEFVPWVDSMEMHTIKSVHVSPRPTKTQLV